VDVLPSIGSPGLSRIFKILPRAEWEKASRAGLYEGSAVDRADGFIHFSTTDQAPETARRHFAGQHDLVVLAVEADALGAALKWEPSRGGELFPHLYGTLSTGLVLAVTGAPLGADGVPDLGDLAG
jgi:uncharacterized protein (DUF952 family)